MVLEFLSNNLAFFLFLLFVGLFIFWKRDRLEIQGMFPFLYMALLKTSWGINKMASWAKKYPKIFLYLSYLSVFIGVFGMFFVYVFLIWQLFWIVDQGLTSGGGLVLPLETESGDVGGMPVIAPPFAEWLIAILFLMIVHEFAHGVIAKRFGIKVRSSGLAFLGSAIIGLLIIVFNFSLEGLLTLDPGFLIAMALGLFFVFVPFLPGAFVEPDEESMKKAKTWKRVAVLGAGSTSNLIFGTLFAILTLLSAPLFAMTIEDRGLHFSGVSEESDLYEKGVESGQIIEVEGRDDPNEIVQYFNNLDSNETLSITLKENEETSTYNITSYAAGEDNDALSLGDGMIGLLNLEHKIEPKEGYSIISPIIEFLVGLFMWIAILNIAIGIINLLPLWITDGGQILKILAEKVMSEDRAILLLHFFSLIGLALIILTLWPTLLM